MTPKQLDRSSTTAGTDKPGGRKKWKKKSPIDIVVEQGDKVRAEIAEKEGELEELRRQLEKFDEARKIFEKN